MKSKKLLFLYDSFKKTITFGSFLLLCAGIFYIGAAIASGWGESFFAALMGGVYIGVFSVFVVDSCYFLCYLSENCEAYNNGVEKIKCKLEIFLDDFVPLLVLFLIIFFGAIYLDDFRVLIDWFEYDIYILKLIFISLLSFVFAYYTDFSTQNFRGTIKYYLLLITLLPLLLEPIFNAADISLNTAIEGLTLFYTFFALLAIFCLYLGTIGNNIVVAKITAFLLWTTLLTYTMIILSFWCLVNPEKEPGMYCSSVFMSIEKSMTKA